MISDSIDLYDDPRLNEGETVWMGGSIAAHPHVIDDLFVQTGSVDAAFRRVLRRIEVRTEMLAGQAEDRLDAMVEAGNARQRHRMLEFQLPVFKAYRDRFGAHLVINSGYRTIDQQRALCERWQAAKNPDGVMAPRPPHHRVGGLAIDVAGHDEHLRTHADLLNSYDAVQRAEVRRLSEPWHYEFDPDWDHRPPTRSEVFRYSRDEGVGFWRSLWLAVLG